METAPRNCRFLSLVVVELVLNKENPQKEFQGVREGVREGGFGARSLHAGVILLQNTVHQEFKGGGSQGLWGGGFQGPISGVISLCLCAFSGLVKSGNTPKTLSEQILSFQVSYGWRSPNAAK